MAIDLRRIQARKDRTLREDLEQDRGVKRALEKLEERSSGFGFGARRRLLTGALRLTRTMAPEVADALRQAKEAMGFEEPVEVYVRPEPVFNAFCMRNGPGPVVICLSSHLLEKFTPAELQFVIGHELGHAAFRHLELPMPWTATIEDLAGPMVSRQTALNLYVWCRGAELSADRAGLLASRDPESATRSFFKLASGVSSDRIKPDLEEYASQVDSLAATPEARSKPRDDDDTLDCFDTHPYSPVRVRALVAFSKSQAYKDAVGDGPGTISDDDLAAIIERDLSLMEPTYLQEKSAKANLLRRLLYNGGLLVAGVTNGIDEKEIEAMRALLGADEVMDGAVAANLSSARGNFESQAKEALGSTTLAERARLVQHLTIVAAADGVVDDEEMHEMIQCAGLLGVASSVVDQTVRGAAEPMD